MYILKLALTICYRSLHTMQSSSGSSKIKRQVSAGGMSRVSKVSSERHKLADVYPTMFHSKADEAFDGVDIPSPPEMILPSSHASDEPDSDLELDGYLEKDSKYDWTSIPAHTTTLSLLNDGRRKLNDSKEMHGSLKRKLDPEIYSASRQAYAYWPVEGWTHSMAEPLSIPSTGKVKVGWKESRQWVEEEEDDPESPTIGASQRRVESKHMIVRTRSGRAIKRVNKDWLVGTSITKRSRSDPLPTIRRGTTPPSTSHIDRGGPNRPQSAMKHKSANKYTSGKDEEITVVTSPCQMPKADTSPAQTPFSDTAVSQLYPNSPLQAESGSKSLLLPPMDDSDPDAFSPIISKTNVQLSKYILRSRESLPKSDFYQRHKEEEGSPTPEARRREHFVL